MSPKKIKDKNPLESKVIEDIEEEAKPSNPTQHKEEISTCGIFDEVGELVVDVFETNADFVVSAAIAGIQIKDLDISLEKDMMIIKGNRCDPHSDSDKKYFYQECYWGPFSRKIILPENIDIDKADAQIDKGILTVKIPRNEMGNGKIGIKVS